MTMFKLGSSTESNRRKRWMEIILEYNYDLQYLKGQANMLADSLSRLPIQTNLTIADQLLDIETLLCQPEKLALQQRKDTNLKQYFLDPHSRKDQNITVKQGCLFKQVKIDDAKTQQPIIPKNLQQEVLSKVHDLNHFSIQKTYETLRRKCFWKGMWADIRNKVLSCENCSLFRKPSYAGTTGSITEEAVGQNWSMDILGPFPESQEGHKYLLTFIDTTSGFPEALPLKRITGTEVRRAILDTGYRFGFAQTYRCDNGTQFRDVLTQALIEAIGAELQFTAIYHPQGNSKIERMHQDLSRVIAKNAQNGSDWTEQVQKALFGIRAAIAVNKEIKVSPFEKMFHREPRVPKLFPGNFPPENIQRERAEMLQQRLFEESTRPVDNRSLTDSFVRDEIVFIRFPGHKRKLQPKNDGPFKIIGATTIRDTVRVTPLAGARRRYRNSIIVHKSRLVKTMYAPSIHRRSSGTPAIVPTRDPSLQPEDTQAQAPVAEEIDGVHDGTTATPSSNSMRDSADGSSMMNTQQYTPLQRLTPTYATSSFRSGAFTWHNYIPPEG